jgi:hypothetical protein
MKREIRFRSALATAVFAIALLSTPLYARAKKDESKSFFTTIVQFFASAESRLSPPWPDQDPDPTTTDPTTTGDETSTDTTGTEVTTTTT